MVWMHMFCFWCSVRLGSLVAGVFNVITAIITTILFIVYCGNEDKLRQTIGILRSHEIVLPDAVMTAFKNDPQILISTVFVILAIYIASCAVMIYGTYAMAPYFIIPFIGLEFIRLIGIFVIHVAAMKIIKKQVNLGELIADSVAGGFGLLFMFYLWACVVSLYQMLIEINAEKNHAILNISEMTGIVTPTKQSTIAIEPYTKTESYSHGNIYSKDFSYYEKPRKTQLLLVDKNKIGRPQMQYPFTIPQNYNAYRTDENRHFNYYY